MKAALMSLMAVMYGVAFLEGGLLSSKDRWSNKISLDEVERILRDEGHEPMAQVQKDKEESDFIIQRRHTATPAHSQGLVTDLSNTAAQVILADQECGLQETVVKLVQPGGVSWYYPSAVKLFRCMGSSGFLSPHVQHCAVTRQQQLAVQVFEFFPSGNYLFTTTNVMNHTACDKDCVVQASDCKPNVESYNNQTCSCDCVTVTACNTTFQVWDQPSCGCRCKYPATNCPTGQEWNSDPNVCGCAVKEPDVICSAGESLDMSTCTCEASNTT